MRRVRRHCAPSAVHPWALSLSAAMLALALANTGCGDAKESAPSPLVVDEQPAETYLVGIRSEDFQCDSLLSADQRAQLFGGRITPMESQFTPPTGVPKACNYVSYEAGREPVHWSFDLDCREGALADAGKLLVSYASAPDAMPQRIGQSALDHHNSALLFIDDDTPCYGRVLGPDREVRRQLALHLASALSPRTAPTGAHFSVRD